jgi:hypothetical protein
LAIWQFLTEFFKFGNTPEHHCRQPLEGDV